MQNNRYSLLLATIDIYLDGIELPGQKNLSVPLNVIVASAGAIAGGITGMMLADMLSPDQSRRCIQIGMATGAVTLETLTTTSAYIHHYVCWRKNQSYRSPFTF